jgi:hypothetical protein
MSAGPCIGRDRPAGGAFSNAADLFGDEISMSVASVVVSKFHLLQSVCTDIDTLYVVPAKTDLVHGNSIMYPRMATLPDHSIQRSTI